MLRIAFLKRWQVSRKISGKIFFEILRSKIFKKKNRKFCPKKNAFFWEFFSKNVKSEKVNLFGTELFVRKTPRILLKTILGDLRDMLSAFLT